MPKGTPSLLYSAPCEAGFDAEKFLSLARSVFSNVSDGDGRIRSGRHIPRGFKNLVSSYKIIASHTPLMGGGRIDVAVVKLCPGAELTPEKEESVIRFVEACAVSDGGGVLACVPPAGERRGLVALAVSSPVKSVEVPRELMDFICAEGLKMYIHKSCGLSEAALDGADVVLDALDGNGARSVVFRACEKLGVPFVHGAIGGLYGETAVLRAGDVPPWELFGAGDKGEEVECGNPPFTPPFIASAQAAEAVRILTRGDETQRKTLFWFDISRLTVRRLNLK